MVNETPCPEERLEEYLYWLNSQNFGRLRAYEPENGFRDKNAYSLEKYEYFNEVSTRLFEYTDADSRELKCDEDVHRTVKNWDLSMHLAYRDEEANRAYILGGLTEHVAGCLLCLSNYEELVKKIAEAKVQGIKVCSKKGLDKMLKKTMLIVDFNLLGLLEDLL